MPLISIIIPTFNALRWLPETLASVVAQEVADMELVIVDDGSTDETPAYIQTHWPHARYVRTENHGVSHARNLGTQLATGEFVQYLDADDVLLPGKLARQVALLRASPESDIVYSNWQRWKAQPDGRFEPDEIIARTIAEVNHDPEVAFFTSMWCPTGAYLYRRSFLDSVLPWKEWLPVIQDARFALDCAISGARWLHDPVVSVLYRQHQAGSVSTRNQLAFLRDCLANADSIAKIWQDGGALSAPRKAAVINEYLRIGSNVVELDPAMFREVHRSLLALDPNFTPKGWRRRVMAGLLGYELAERLLARCRHLCFVKA